MSERHGKWVSSWEKEEEEGGENQPAITVPLLRVGQTRWTMFQPPIAGSPFRKNVLSKLSSLEKKKSGCILRKRKRTEEPPLNA